jgi:membrane fusion protein (multidrug efflux system)
MIVACFGLGMIATGAAQAQAPAPAVLVQPAVMRSLTPQSEFIGRVKALDKVELRARVQGFLGPRLFKAGDQVKQGQLLFQIERDPFEPPSSSAGRRWHRPRRPWRTRRSSSSGHRR